MLCCILCCVILCCTLMWHHRPTIYINHQCTSTQTAMASGAATLRSHYTVVDAAWQLLKAPFADQRSATYQMMSVMCARAWMAVQLVAHEEMLMHVLDPSSEIAKQVFCWQPAKGVASSCDNVLCPTTNCISLIHQPLYSSHSCVSGALRW